MSEAWLISAGSYSDYTIWCVFEREGDAVAYARHVNATDLLRRHNDAVSTDYTPPNAQYKCSDPIESCPGCARWWHPIVENGGEWSCRVERVEFHPAGDRPFRPYKYVTEALMRTMPA